MEKRIEPHSLEDLFMHLSYYFIKRSSRGQKNRAVEYLAEVLGPKRLRAEHVPVAGIKLNYYVCGDLSQAKKVFLAPLDTPKRAFSKKYRYTPFDDNKSKSEEQKNMLLLTLRRFLPGLAAFGLALLLPTEKRMFIAMAAMILLTLWQGLGEASAPNFNKSTASLSLLLWMAVHNMSQDTAYVFLDHCAESPAGLKAFLARNKEELWGKCVIYMDCLASGEKLVLAQGAGNCLPLPEVPTVEWMRFDPELLPGILRADPQLYVLFSGVGEGTDFSVPRVRTADDCKIDINRLKAIAQWLTTI